MAALIGISYSEFLKITPKILNTYIKAFVERKHLESKENIYQAYLISRWVWQKKVDIEKILVNKPKKKKMTNEEMLAQVKVLNSLFGGEVKEVGTEK